MPGVIGTPALAMIRRDSTLDPIATMAFGWGPIQTSPASVTALAKAALSARKP